MQSQIAIWLTEDLFQLNCPDRKFKFLLLELQKKMRLTNESLPVRIEQSLT